jgi:aromatic-L-amino-acid decarboxylase
MTFREDGAEALDWAARYLEGVRDLPVRAEVEPGELRARLPAAPPEEPEEFTAVLRDLDEVILPAVTHWQSPRFFGYFAVTGSEPGILAELLTATLNPVAFNWRASPAATELEAVVLSWAAQLLGLPDGWHGHIEDTASTSTIAEHANSSVFKAIRLLGMETRVAPADGEYRMRPDELALDDVAAVVATVGTTATTSVDPVPAVADACERAGAWLHVDAAYAGAAWVCPELAWSRAGVERADSVVVNAHKWLFTPMDCSLLWSRRPEDLRAAFSLVPSYLETGVDAPDLSEYGPALGRRFRALKLWTVLRCYGRGGLQRLIREHVRLAELFEGWVRDEPGWEVCAPRPFSVVCFRRDGSNEDNAALLERVNASGEAFLSHGELDGRYVLRLAVGNARTTEDDVRLAWDVLRREAAAV